MQIYEFYRKYSDLPPSKRNVILNVRHNPLTPFIIFKQLEDTRKQQRFYKDREEELLRIAEETFDDLQVSKL